MIAAGAEAQAGKARTSPKREAEPTPRGLENSSRLKQRNIDKKKGSKSVNLRAMGYQRRPSKSKRWRKPTL